LIVSIPSGPFLIEFPLVLPSGGFLTNRHEGEARHCKIPEIVPVQASKLKPGGSVCDLDILERGRKAGTLRILIDDRVVQKATETKAVGDPGTAAANPAFLRRRSRCRE
jgi:hypothetical protein